MKVTVWHRDESVYQQFVEVFRSSLLADMLWKKSKWTQIDFHYEAAPGGLPASQ